MGRKKGRKSDFCFNREILLFFHRHVKNKSIHGLKQDFLPIEFWIFKNNLSSHVTCTGCKSGSVELVSQSQCFLALGDHGGPLSTKVWVVSLGF